MSTDQLYLITGASAFGGDCVVIVCAVGRERNALLREHGNDARVEETPGGWEVWNEGTLISYRVFDAVAGRETMEQLLADGLDVHVRLDYFMGETSENTHLST